MMWGCCWHLVGRDKNVFKQNAQAALQQRIIKPQVSILPKLRDAALQCVCVEEGRSEIKKQF